MEYLVSFWANIIFCQLKYLCRETWYSLHCGYFCIAPSLPGFNPLLLSSFWYPLALALEETMESYLTVAVICGGLCHISHQFCLFQAEESWSVVSCIEVVPDLVNYFSTFASSSLHCRKGSGGLSTAQSIPDVGTSWVHAVLSWYYLFFFCPPFLISSKFQLASAHCWVELCASIPTSPFVW